MADLFAMSFKRGPHLPRLEDLWNAWAFAALEAQLALDHWTTAARDIKASAFASYRAALDREERAAMRLAEAYA